MSQTSQRYTLDNLAARANGVKSQNFVNGAMNGTPNGDIIAVRKPHWNGLTWFIVIALVVALIFFLFRPDMVLSTNQQNGEKYLDWGKLILWSLAIALVIVLILWLIQRSSGNNVELERVY